MKAWHFVRPDMRLGYDDGRLVVPGETLTVDVEPELCARGLHASKSPLDALGYATWPSPVICRAKMGGVIVHGDDKLAATERACLWAARVPDDLLRKFARMCALDVVHLWDAPDVVVRYLRTGDESIRAAARAAAWAARAAARAAAEDAARAAAWAAARAAAGDVWAARDAARATQSRRLHRMLMGLRGTEHEVTE